MHGTLSKGLYEFAQDGNAVKADWLSDYVDAFISEAYEHERQESAHRDPNLVLVSEATPDTQIAQAVYGEFMAYTAKNKNLARAKTSLPVTVEYIAARLRELGHVHTNTSMDEAEAQAQVAGYFPTALALSMDGFARSQAELSDATARMGALRKSDGHVTLADDAVNPMQALSHSQRVRTEQRAEAYGEMEKSVGTHDEACLFHGREAVGKKSHETSIQGMICTCR